MDNNKELFTIPYVVHESVMHRMDEHNKRLAILAAAEAFIIGVFAVIICTAGSRR